MEMKIKMVVNFKDIDLILLKNKIYKSKPLQSIKVIKERIKYVRLYWRVYTILYLVKH